MIRKIGLALVLMTITGVAAAHDSDARGTCEHVFWFEWCKPDPKPTPVTAPEIDPASATAGLTLLAGGLAVLRGRRKITVKV